jgi:hypothetical protein
MSEIDYIKAEALGIEEGATQAVYCPFCDNEKPYAPSLSVTRTEEGIVYNCYRAVCSGRGFLGSMPYGGAEKAVEKPKTNPWRGETFMLSEVWSAVIESRYNLRPEHVGRWRMGGANNLIMPMVTHEGKVWGVNSKILLGPVGKKSMNYISVPYDAGMHWATPVRKCDTAIVVEDIISATRCCQDLGEIHSVALLGTVFNDTTVKCLMARGIKHVIIALDPDALSKAVWIVNKYRVFFNTLRILSLSKDPKDLTTSEFKNEIADNI